MKTFIYIFGTMQCEILVLYFLLRKQFMHSSAIESVEYSTVRSESPMEESDDALSNPARSKDGERPRCFMTRKA